jgi:antitoxin component of RelBE/YafQ-DinJ toxin-antitoxin module
MQKKTASINIMVQEELKKKLKEKSEQMGLSITQFIEKIALEDIVFLDQNFKKAAQLFKLSM